MTEYVATKQDEAEEYETVLANMSSTLAERDSQIGVYSDVNLYTYLYSFVSLLKLPLKILY